MKQKKNTLPTYQDLEVVDNEYKDRSYNINISIPEFNAVLSSIGSVDSCSDPIKTSYGYHLVWLSGVRPGGSPSLSYHWPEIEAMSLNYKKSLWFQEWLKVAKEDLYIEILN